MSVTVNLLPISSDIFLRTTRRVDCWNCSYVPYQLSPPAVPLPVCWKVFPIQYSISPVASGNRVLDLSLSKLRGSTTLQPLAEIRYVTPPVQGFLCS